MSRPGDRDQVAIKIGNESYTTDPAQLKREVEAERAQAAFVKESVARLAPKCPDCGALGSLEEQPDGAVRCIDCDMVIAIASKLPGFGRR